MRLDARPAGQWTPTKLGVHPVTGGGSLPAYVSRPHDERLRAILAPPVADSRMAVLRGEPGTSRAGAGAAAGVLARRAAGAGMFGLFLASHPGAAVSYRYGCEPDPAPAPPWRWAPPGR